MNPKFQPYLSSLEDPIKEELYEEDSTWNAISHNISQQNHQQNLQLVKHRRSKNPTAMNTPAQTPQKPEYNFHQQQQHENVFSNVQTPRNGSGMNTPLSKPMQAKRLKLKVNLVLLNNREVQILVYEGIEVGLSVLKACLEAGIQDTAMIEIIKRKIVRDLRRREQRTPKISNRSPYPERLSKSDKKPRITNYQNPSQSSGQRLNFNKQTVPSSERRWFTQSQLSQSQSSTNFRDYRKQLNSESNQISNPMRRSQNSTSYKNIRSFNKKYSNPLLSSRESRMRQSGNSLENRSYKTGRSLKRSGDLLSKINNVLNKANSIKHRREESQQKRDVLQDARNFLKKRKEQNTTFLAKYSKMIGHSKTSSLRNLNSLRAKFKKKTSVDKVSHKMPSFLSRRNTGPAQMLTERTMPKLNLESGLNSISTYSDRLKRGIQTMRNRSTSNTGNSNSASNNVINTLINSSRVRSRHHRNGNISSFENLRHELIKGVINNRKKSTEASKSIEQESLSSLKASYKLMRSKSRQKRPEILQLVKRSLGSSNKIQSSNEKDGEYMRESTQVHNFESQNTVIVKKSIDLKSSEDQVHFLGKIKNKNNSLSKRFDSGKTQKIELSALNQTPGTNPSSGNPTHVRKKSNLTLNMGLIENYEPSDIKIEKIETQKKKQENYSGQNKRTNGKPHHTPNENSINIPEPKLEPELEEPRQTFSPTMAKISTRNLFSNLQVGSESKFQLSSGKKCSQSIEISVRKSEDKLNLLSSIFKIMDSDRDGLISPDNFDLSGIPTEMLEFLEAILVEIHQSKSPTNFLNFVDIVDRYNLLGDLDRVRPSHLSSPNKFRLSEHQFLQTKWIRMAQEWLTLQTLWM